MKLFALLFSQLITFIFSANLYASKVSDRNRNDNCTTAYAIAIIGDRNVGKSSFMSHIRNHEFTYNTIATFGIDLEIFKINCKDNSTRKIFLLDSSIIGRDRVNGMILSYDLTDWKYSLKNVILQYKEYLEVNKIKYLPVMFLGFKKDQLGEDQDVEERIQDFINKNKFEDSISLFWSNKEPELNRITWQSIFENFHVFIES